MKFSRSFQSSLIFFLLLGAPSFSDPFVFFQPPKGWLVANPSLFKKGIKIGFVQSKTTTFSPSMSLTLEYIGSASLQTYLSAVQKQRLAKAHATVRDLGILQTPSGKVHLALIEESNHLGPLQILQGITLYEQYAIIYTAVALKKDFPSLQTDILESLRSLRSFPSVLEAIQDSKKKQWLSNRLEKIQEMHKKYSQKSEESLSFNSLFQENCWSSFSEEFLAEFAHKEPYWLFAALREIKNQLTESPLK